MRAIIEFEYNFDYKPLEVVADLTKEDDVKRLVNSTINEYGKIDILVNNAGSGVLSAIRDDKILNEFDNVFNIDVRSIVELTHLSVPYLEKSKGTIINISSIAALSPVCNENSTIIYYFLLL